MNLPCTAESAKQKFAFFFKLVAYVSKKRSSYRYLKLTALSNNRGNPWMENGFSGTESFGLCIKDFLSTSLWNWKLLLRNSISFS